MEWPRQPESAILETSLSWLESLDKANDSSKFISETPTKFVQIKH